jgi:hypothetical protein
MTEQPDRSPPHLYVPQGQFPVAANINEPRIEFADAVPLPPAKPLGHISRPGPYVRVLSDLPDRLPVLSQEVALIRAYLPALLALIAANDNDPSHV